MNAEQFAYWLQGYSELTETTPTAEQWQSIREHLALVFTKVMPPLSLAEFDPPPVQKIVRKTHPREVRLC